MSATTAAAAATKQNKTKQKHIICSRENKNILRGIAIKIQQSKCTLLLLIQPVTLDTIATFVKICCNMPFSCDLQIMSLII